MLQYEANRDKQADFKAILYTDSIFLVRNFDELLGLSLKTQVEKEGHFL